MKPHHKIGTPSVTAHRNNHTCIPYRSHNELLLKEFGLHVTAEAL